jgi:hypothetical protein
MSFENEITTSAGRYFWKEVEKNLGLSMWSTVGKTIIAIENEMRERIAREIEQIDLGGPSQVNGLGMRMLAAKAARDRK